MFRLFLVAFVLSAGAGSMYALEKSAAEYRSNAPVEQIIYGTRTGPNGQEMLVTVR